VKRITATFILLLVAVAHSRAEQLPIRAYTTADGLARDGVSKIVTDPRGFLWFCTYDGLSRFDGYEFVNYSVAQGLPHRSVQDLLITRKGDYWVATSGGVARFNAFASTSAPKFKVYVPTQRPSSEFVTDLYEDSSGTIWVGTANGLFALRESGGDWQFEYIPLEKSDERLDITSIVEDSPGVLWVGTEQGLFRRSRDGNAERFTTAHGLPHPHVRDILRDPDGTVWVATGVGLCRLVSNVRSGESIVSVLYRKKDGLLGENIYALFRTSSGWLWLATTQGLSEFSPDPLPGGGHFINYTREHGLKDAGLRSIAEDHDGNLWVGSESGGAMKITRRGLISYSEADGLESQRITAIGEDRNGELYVLTGSLKVPSYHIHGFDGRRFQNIRVNLPPDAAPTWGWNQLFVHDRMQQWWVPAANGLFEFPAMRSFADLAKARPLKKYSSQNGLSGDEPFRVFEDSRGDLWISIISGPAESYLNRWERATGKFDAYSREIASRRDSAPTAFQEDRQGNIWVGFYWGGLARYRNGKFESFTKADGIPAGMIRALYVDAKGRLWIASTEGGLGRVDDPTQDHPSFVRYTMKEGLSTDQTTCVTEDPWGRIYIGTSIGVDRLDPATGRVKRYTIADGLPNGYVNVAYRDRNNALWFGTLQGLSKLEPSIDDGASQPPPILIQHVRVAGNDLPISELGVTEMSDLEFEAGKNQFEIKFVSLGFRTGDVLRYQFMLEGADKDWGAPINQRVVNYANLRPGSYRFLARAVNADGIVSSQPAAIAFTIVPPVWQRWWFIALVVLLVVVLTHLIYQYHTRRLIELERVRTRIATDLHDDIGASLSKIAILSDVAGQELSTARESPVAAPLAQIADTSRDCVDAMSDIVWAINPQRDHLSDLTYRMRRFAEDLLDAKDIDFTIRSTLDEKDTPLGADLRREIYLIFKECVNNLAKHSGCRNASLTFDTNGPWLIVAITDDGRGFKVEEPLTNGHGAGMGGHGLASMQRRAKALGGSLQINSEPGRGTTVTLKVLLKQGRRWPWFNYPNRR